MSLSQVEVASKTFKFHNLIETHLHPANSYCNISLSSYLRQIYITTFAATSDMAGVQSGGITDQDVQAGEFFAAQDRHPGIALTNHGRTATVVSNIVLGITTCSVLGGNIYDADEHDIRIQLDNVPDFCYAWIGTTNKRKLPLNLGSREPGFSGWNGRYTHQIHTSGVLANNVDVGQPWLSGDVLRLHLNCDSLTLRVHHERTGKSHTISDVTGPQRLFITMTAKDTSISIL